MNGKVSAVKQATVGTELESDVSAAETVLPLVDLHELDWNPGQLQIGDEIISYTVDAEAEVLTLDAGLASGYSAEEAVYQYPLTIERVAYLQGAGQSEELVARVPHALYDRLPEGIREDEASAELVEADLFDGELVVTDVIGREPESDVGFLSGMEINAGSVEIDIPPSFGHTAIGSDPIEHGLSEEPTAIFVGAVFGVGEGTARLLATVGFVDDETFTIRVRDVRNTNLNDAGSSFIRVYWMAIYGVNLMGRVALPVKGTSSSDGYDSGD